ncbi:hypothetical protein CBM2608_A210122 [Cupriavidus taiwanensis]|nr:hypothetical protein CBM2608_A210122 [Cupriavidus taiwanensis]
MSRPSSSLSQGGPQVRVSSPAPGRSILITSAPKSARFWAHHGPARTRVRSRTRRWLKAPMAVFEAEARGIGCGMRALGAPRKRGGAGWLHCTTGKSPVPPQVMHAYLVATGFRAIAGRFPGAGADLPGGLPCPYNQRFANPILIRRARPRRGKRPPSHESLRHSQQVPAVLRIEGPYRGPLVQPGADERPDAAVHQFRHGAVQGRVPGHRQAPLQPRHLGAALGARGRQAQ